MDIIVERSLTMRVAVVLALCVAAVAAVPRGSQRIVGGDVTTINMWPSMANLMFSWTGLSHAQACGGTVINQRSILSAAHCFDDYGAVDPAFRWRVRLGSSFRSSGGTIYDVGSIIMHSSYNSPVTYDNDVAILRLASNIVYSNLIQAASIGSYQIADNQAVWATGWGLTTNDGAASEQLRQVQVYTINQSTCASRYGLMGMTISNGMLCSGVLNVGGRDQCQGDSGGPLYHNGIVVGVCSWGGPCASAYFPGVNARVSHYTSWIQNNA